MNILIIDDEAGLRNGLAKRLRIEGYEVYEASDSKETRELMKQHKIHIVLLDLRLADEDGHTLLHEIKQTEPESSIIIITGYGTIQSAVQCMKAGASNYLTKPIDQDMLLTSISREMQTINLQSEPKIWSFDEGSSIPMPTSESILKSSPETPRVNSGVSIGSAGRSYGVRSRITSSPETISM